jgi:hypothetical protein
MEFGKERNFILLITPPRGIGGSQCATFTKLLNPIATVVIVSTDTTTENGGAWLDDYRVCLSGYDSMIFAMDTADYGVPISIKRSVSISIDSTRIGQFGSVVEATEILYNIARVLVLAKHPVPVTPRSVLIKHNNSFATSGKDYIFLPPRGDFDKAIYSLDEPLPTLRNTCVRLSPPPSYTPRNVDAYMDNKTEFDMKRCVFLNHNILAMLYGLPLNYVQDSFTTSTKLYTNTLPPHFTRIIADALFDVPMNDQARMCTRQGVFLPININNKAILDVSSLSPNQQLMFQKTPEELVDRNSLFCPKSRMGKLVAATTTAKIEFFIGRNGTKRKKVRYMIGSDTKGDIIAHEFVKGLNIPDGWTVELKERKDTTHAKEDLYWVSPIGITFRTTKTLKASLLREKAKEEKQCLPNIITN